ncbi:hypothetical protein BOTBODRAFT_540043 [Botryobasidium botryosum FD-172 SS1]|uniref:Palmitoyltransferase n=1 Tax=Botryobasidium botryosum (strain FD-172 SS1) TaxID=930990 RepID=A0A067MAR4_BOTB1|nr:hypothetical protein BOTBODRAFT_540043 [Botryobasidium botryosum FD-172 SS1]
MADPTSIVSKKGDPVSLVSTEQGQATISAPSQTRTTHESEEVNIFSAAQRGDVQQIRELVESGRAKVTDRDDQNVTPLHWAAINAQLAACRYLLEQGAEVDALGGDLIATPMQWAARIQHTPPRDALIRSNAHFVPPSSERNTRIAIFSLPVLFFYVIFTTLSVLPWYTGMPLALAEFFGLHHIVTRVLLNHKNYTDSVMQSPYFSAIILGSLFWVGQVWLAHFVYNTPGYSIANLLYVIMWSFCAYNFFRAITLDPGTCSKPGSDAELKSVIEQLTSEGRLNGTTFCITCMARKPLRSKHCRVCDRCIAKFDQ